MPGVITAVRTNGFFMQDPQPDSDERTSEGVFVFTSSAPARRRVGDAVTVSGRVAEFRPGGGVNLTTTEITGPTVTRDRRRRASTPTLVGPHGRRPPQQVIEDDAMGNVETSGVLFDPREDGLDFHESLEGMLVQIESPEVVGPTNDFGEVPVVGRRRRLRAQPPRRRRDPRRTTSTRSGSSSTTCSPTRRTPTSATASPGP